MPAVGSQKIATPATNPGGVNQYYGQTMTDVIDTILYAYSNSYNVTISGSTITAQKGDGTTNTGTDVAAVLETAIGGL